MQNFGTENEILVRSWKWKFKVGFVFGWFSRVTRPQSKSKWGVLNLSLSDRDPDPDPRGHTHDTCEEVALCTVCMG